MSFGKVGGGSLEVGKQGILMRTSDRFGRGRGEFRELPM